MLFKACLGRYSHLSPSRLSPQNPIARNVKTDLGSASVPRPSQPPFLCKQNTYLHRKLQIQGDVRFPLNALDTADPPNRAKQGPLYLVSDKVHFSTAKWFSEGGGAGSLVNHA